MKGKLLILGLLVLFSWGSVYGQDLEDAPLDTGTIQQQYDYIMRKSSTYEGFKVIKISRFETFKSNIQDSISTAYEKRDVLAKEVGKQKASIDGLTAEVTDLKARLNTAIDERDGLKFLGILMTKAAYKSMMWGIVFVLLAIAIVAYLLFKRSNSVTKSTKKELAEVKEEFEEHRKRALKREQDLAVKYHSELNKLKQRMS